MYKHRYLIKCARHISGIVFIGYAHSHDSQKIGKQNNLEVFHTLKVIYLYAPIT